MFSSIVIKRGKHWTVIRNVVDIEIPYICTNCNYTEHRTLLLMEDVNQPQCSDCSSVMIPYHIPNDERS